jgi:hypothetical protein
VKSSSARPHERGDRHKDEFSPCSHELRNPLAHSNAVEIIAAARRTAAVSREVIERQVKHLRGSWTICWRVRITRGNINLSARPSGKAPSWLRHRDHRPLIAEQRHELSWMSDERWKWRRSHAPHQVLGNLLNN